MKSRGVRLKLTPIIFWKCEYSTWLNQDNHRYIFSQIFGCIAMVVSICNLQLNISYPWINNIFTDLCLLTVFIQHNKINCNLLYFFFYKTFYKYFYKMYTKQFQVRHTLQMKVFKQIKSIPR